MIFGEPSFVSGAPVTSCAFCYTDICLIVKMAIAIAYAMGIPKFICFNDMFVCRKCAARLCAFSNHLIQRSHIMRIGKNPHGSGSKHSRRKRSECDFLLCFHCISSMKTFARPGVYPQNAKVVPAACLPSVAFSRTKSCSHVEPPRSLHRFFPIICRNHIVYPPSYPLRYRLRLCYGHSIP